MQIFPCFFSTSGTSTETPEVIFCCKKSAIFARPSILYNIEVVPQKLRTMIPGYMKKLLTFLLLITTICGFSQKLQKVALEKPKQDSKIVWEKGARLSLFAGQAGSKNWASATDVFSVSANAFVNAFANRTRGKWFFNNSLIASYGLINNDEYATIKNDDKVDLFSTVGVCLKKQPTLGLAAAFNFRSQFANGYDRDYLNQGIKRRTSGFFAPAYITIAPIGVTYHAHGWDLFATVAGIRGVIVSNKPYSYVFQGGVIPDGMINQKNPASQERSVAEMYGVDPARTIQYQVGPYISAAYNHHICKNIEYAGRIDLLSDLTHRKPENVDVFWTNTFYLKVNNWLNAVYSLDLAYDDDIKKFGYYKNHAALQSKSILGLGVSAHCGGKKRMHKGRNE
jgi:Protein of unknown function (DUF3078)